MTRNERIKYLEERINEYNGTYRTGNPIVNDQKYDELVNELQELDPSNPWFRSIEPAPVSPGRKRRLPVPMKSLNKVKNMDDVTSWLKSLGIPRTGKVVIMPKFDGVSWLRDESGDLTYSRGGADNEGQDCSTHFRVGGFMPYSSASQQQDCQLWGEFTFGELVFSCENWQANFAGKVSDATGEPYRSPRNTIAGLINRDEPSGALRHATFYRYGIDPCSTTMYSTYTEILDMLCRTFSQPNLSVTITADLLSEPMLNGLFKDWRKLYYIDGLVIYLDDLRLWEAIGRQQTSGNPLYAIAYKHPDFAESFITRVKGIEWKVSKAGALKPVVNIEAVDTGDCVMENPTGYNAGWIFKRFIGQGAELLVTRSGGVIPKILQVITPASPDTLEREGKALSVCPVCGSPTRMDEQGVELYCTNSFCEGVKLAKIMHFFTVLKYENLGEETVTRIFNTGKHSVRDFLDLKWDDIVAIEGLGESMANSIIEQNRKTRQGVPVSRLMHASDCFKGIGEIKAEKFLEELDEIGVASFMKGWWIDTIQDKLVQGVFEYLPVTTRNIISGYKDFVYFMEATGIPPVLPEKVKPMSDKYRDMVVCFSGVRSSEIENRLRAGSGLIANAVSKKVTHLVVKSADSSSSKTVKAKKLGIPILTLQEFADIL